jgi:site-specific DNA-methyltransferase (adenine-specific)
MGFGENRAFSPVLCSGVEVLKARSLPAKEKKLPKATRSGSKRGVPGAGRRSDVWTVSENLTLDFLSPEIERPIYRDRIVTRSGRFAALAQMDAIAFLKSLPDHSIDLIVTDPAYSGMNDHLQLGKGRIVGDYKLKGKGGKWFQEFKDSAENYSEFLKEAFRVLKKDSHIYLMFDSYSMLTLGPLVREVFALKNVLVWDKVNIGMGHYFRRQSEFILFGCKGKKGLTGRGFPDIIKVKRIHKAAYPTQKPVALFETFIAASLASREANAVVCDPFFGSGATALAALRKGHSFVGADISAKAMELAAQRLNAFDLGHADPFEKLAGTGR